ncbi:DUF2255 family protein [Nostocoides jenkinsii]|uniref:DUF2255 family protein n=1 Tax=Nostocoides jenkinsii Ben 74 TaxID=1193518 RepID=A0A077MAD3_9MICO|nr:DUF2255 family protein [Tetrasphaera jenkinsii]CCI51653.1 conserved hypothetical protein [Tetrasphaera jenkinsii Ben 74]
MTPTTSPGTPTPPQRDGAAAGAGWSSTDLDRLGSAGELRIASRRADGSLRPFVIIWVTRVDDAIYVRSAHGVDNPWYRRALASGRGRISAGGVERDVRFEVPDASVHEAIDTASHAKYDRYGPGPVGAITGPHAWPATLRLVRGGLVD